MLGIVTLSPAGVRGGPVAARTGYAKQALAPAPVGASSRWLHGVDCGRGHVHDRIATLVGLLGVVAAEVFAFTWLPHASLLADTATLSAGYLHVGRVRRSPTNSERSKPGVPLAFVVPMHAGIP